MDTQRMKERVIAFLPRFTIVFCVLQPLLDVLGYWQNKVGITNGGTLTVRLLLLLATVIAGFLLSDKKWIYLVAGGTFACYLTGHIFACVHNGYTNPLEDLTEQTRIFLMPATFVCFSTFLRKNEKVFPALQKGLILDAAIILFVEVLSVLTGTDPHTYSNKGIGILGWFIWANSQSAILSILCPLSIAWAIRRFRNRLFPVLVAALVSFGLLFFAATRLAYASACATGVSFSVCLLYCGRQYRKTSLSLIFLTAVFIALIPVSPMIKNQEAVAENAEKKQALVGEVVSAYGVPADALETDDMHALGASYRYMLQGLVDRFGLERVAGEYRNSLDVSRIWDRRQMQLTGCRLLMEDSTPAARWFGMELCRMRQETDIYDFDTGTWERDTLPFDPENDFLGVYYLCGAVGLVMILSAIAVVGIRALAALIRRPRQVMTPAFAAFAISFGIALAYAYATVSVLRRNNASVYFALVLAGLMYLSKPDVPNQSQEVCAC